jgi:hypothetical protein
MYKRILIALVLAVVTYGCQQEGEESLPILSANVDLSDVNSINVHIDMAKNGSSIKEYGVIVDSLHINTISTEHKYAISDGTSNVSIKKIFLKGQTFYYRPYALTSKGIVLGKEKKFIGMRDIFPNNLMYSDLSELHKIDTIVVFGNNFEFYKDKISAELVSSWDDTRISELSVKYLDKNNLKVYGNMVAGTNLKLKFGKEFVTNNNSVGLYSFKNIVVDKNEAYFGDTLTISWDGVLDERDDCSFDINYAPLSILKKDKKSIIAKIENIGNLGTEVLSELNISINYNSHIFNKKLAVKNAFKKYPIKDASTGDKIVIPLNRKMINNEKIFLSSEDFTIPKIELVKVDSMHVSFEVPSPYLMDSYMDSGTNSVNFILSSVLSNSTLGVNGGLTINYESPFGNVVGYRFGTLSSARKLILKGDMCLVVPKKPEYESTNFNRLEYVKIQNLNGNINYGEFGRDMYFQTFTYDYSRHKYYYIYQNGYYYNAGITDDLLNDIDQFDFEFPLKKTKCYSTFADNGILYIFVPHDYDYGIDNSVLLVKLDIDNKKTSYNQINVQFDKSPSLTGNSINSVLENIVTHSINGDIYMDIMSYGCPSIFKLNKVTMEFEYVGEFPGANQGVKMRSYDVDNKWYTIVGSKVWVFDGFNWSIFAEMPYDANVYFEYNNSKYWGPKGTSNLYKINY